MENVHHSRFVIFSLFQSIFPDETFLTPCGCRWELYRFFMFTSSMSYCDHFLAPWDHNLNLKLLPFFWGNNNSRDFQIPWLYLCSYKQLQDNTQIYLSSKLNTHLLASKLPTSRTAERVSGFPFKICKEKFLYQKSCSSLYHWHYIFIH